MSRSTVFDSNMMKRKNSSNYFPAAFEGQTHDQLCGTSEVADYSIDVLKSRSGNCYYRKRQIRIDLHNQVSEVQFYKSEALDANSIQASVPLSVDRFWSVGKGPLGSFGVTVV